MFDEDSFSKDDYLGKVVIDINQYIDDSMAENGAGHWITLEDDPVENSSKKPTPISGQAELQLR